MKTSHDSSLAVRWALALHLKVDPDTISPNHDLRDRLGLDSFDLVLVATRLEDWLNIEVPFPALDDTSTVNDLTALVAELLEPPPRKRACA